MWDRYGRWAENQRIAGSDSAQLVFFPLKLTIQFPHPVMKTGSTPTRRIVRKYVQLPTFKFSCKPRVFHPAQNKLRLDHLDTEPAID